MDQEMTWAEKLDVPREVEARPVEPGRGNLRAGQLMLYPNGRAVDDVIRTIPAGEARTKKELRAELAQRHGAEVTCPVTTGKCLLTVAEAAHEALQNGTPITEVTPVWRVLDAKASTLQKLTFDPAFILDQRAREGLSPS